MSQRQRALNEKAAAAAAEEARGARAEESLRALALLVPSPAGKGPEGKEALHAFREQLLAATFSADATAHVLLLLRRLSTPCVRFRMESRARQLRAREGGRGAVEAAFTRRR